MAPSGAHYLGQDGDIGSPREGKLAEPVAMCSRNARDASAAATAAFVQRLVIVSPRQGERVPRAGCWWKAWSGERRVVRVEVAVDGGEHWRPAVLLGESRPNDRVRWRQGYDNNANVVDVG